jgi:hypothetical protein
VSRAKYAEALDAYFSYVGQRFDHGKVRLE